MNFNKCSRCGSFYISQGDVCPKCQTMDNIDYSNFKNFVLENGITQLDEMSQLTNISHHHINRYLTYLEKDNRELKVSSKITKLKGEQNEQSI